MFDLQKTLHSRQFGSTSIDMDMDSDKDLTWDTAFVKKINNKDTDMARE